MSDYGTRLNTALAAEIRAERARQKLTVADLVKATGLSKSAVLTYLNDQRDLPFPAFALVSRALGLDPDVLLTRAQQALNE